MPTLALPTDPTLAAPPLRRARPADEPAIIATLLLAFAADPAVRWLFPDPESYLAHGPAFVRAFAGHAFAAGTAYHTADFAGAALWLPPGVHPDEDAVGAVLAASVPEHRMEEVVSGFEQMDAYHLTEPHWYLPLIGVDPTRQGRGLGAALLAPVLAQCDRAGLPAYLESSNPRNISLYERHGFTVVGSIDLENAPPLHPMVRLPQPVG